MHWKHVCWWAFVVKFLACCCSRDGTFSTKHPRCKTWFQEFLDLVLVRSAIWLCQFDRFDPHTLTVRLFQLIDCLIIRGWGQPSRARDQRSTARGCKHTCHTAAISGQIWFRVRTIAHQTWRPSCHIVHSLSNTHSHNSNCVIDRYPFNYVSWIAPLKWKYINDEYIHMDIHIHWLPYTCVIAAQTMRETSRSVPVTFWSANHLLCLKAGWWAHSDLG